jgi:hypothetical protein
MYQEAKPYPCIPHVKSEIASDIANCDLVNAAFGRTSRFSIPGTAPAFHQNLSILPAASVRMNIPDVRKQLLDAMSEKMLSDLNPNEENK